MDESILDFDYEEGNLRDEKLDLLLNSSKISVSEITSDKFGGLSIQFDNKMELQIIPTTSSNSDEYNELWRLIDNRDSESKHIVARISGIELE